MSLHLVDPDKNTLFFDEYTQSATINSITKFKITEESNDPKIIQDLSWILKKDTNPIFSLYDLSDRMHSRRRQIASYSIPANCEDMVIQRVLIRRGFSHDLAQLMIDDLKRCIDSFQTHPITNNSISEGINSFHH